MKRFDRVKVSPELIGTGETIYGYIDDIEEFMGQILYSIRFDHPDALGRLGACTYNEGMFEVLNKEAR